MMSETNAIPEYCKLKFYSKRDTRAPLFLADFTNGRIPIKERDKLKFECFKSNKDASIISSNADRNLQATHGRLNYLGSPVAKTPLKTFVAVRNKTTGKMKMYDAAIFRMKADIKPPSDPEKPQIAAPKSYFEAISDLTENFGSKLKKRALNARKSYASEVSLEASLGDAAALVPVAEASRSQRLMYLPPVNKDAQDITEVYNMNDILSPEEDVALEKEALSLQEASDETIINRMKLFCSFVNSQLEKADLTMIKYLIYYNYLVLFQRLGYVEIRRKDPAPGIPDIFKGKMLSNFTVTSKSENGAIKRSFPQELKDKLVAHLLILALHICNFRVNVNEVIADLKTIKPPKFISIAHALGCHDSTHKEGNETIKFIILKLPLFVPGPKFARKTFK